MLEAKYLIRYYTVCLCLHPCQYASGKVQWFFLVFLHSSVLFTSICCVGRLSLGCCPLTALSQLLTLWYLPSLCSMCSCYPCDTSNFYLFLYCPLSAVYVSLQASCLLTYDGANVNPLTMVCTLCLAMLSKYTSHAAPCICWCMQLPSHNRICQSWTKDDTGPKRQILSGAYHTLISVRLKCHVQQLFMVIFL